MLDVFIYDYESLWFERICNEFQKIPKIFRSWNFSAISHHRCGEFTLNSVLRKWDDKSAIVLFLNVLFYTFGHTMCFIYIHICIPLDLLLPQYSIGRHALQSSVQMLIVNMFLWFCDFVGSYPPWWTLLILVVSRVTVCLSWNSVPHLRWLEKSGIWH